MTSPVSSPSQANGALSSYTFASAKQAKAVQSALDNAYKSTSHQDAIKALKTLNGTSVSSSQTEAKKASATLNAGTTSPSQIAAQKALVTLTALANANESTQNFIAAKKTSSAYGGSSGKSGGNSAINILT